MSKIELVVITKKIRRYKEFDNPIDAIHYAYNRIVYNDWFDNMDDGYEIIMGSDRKEFKHIDQVIDFLQTLGSQKKS